MGQGTLSIEVIPTEALIPFANNSRTHSDEQVAQVAASIKEFGFTNPILIDAEDMVIAGHGRLLAARKLGLKEVPCIRLAHLTETQKRAYVIADNKLALNAGWDHELLALELEELTGEDFTVALTGFSEDELEQLVQGAVEALDALPDLPDGDKPDSEQVTFVLTGEQAETVKEAVRRAKALGDFGDTGNDNSNGNGIARVAETFLTVVGPDE